MKEVDEIKAYWGSGFHAIMSNGTLDITARAKHDIAYLLSALEKAEEKVRELEDNLKDAVFYNANIRARIKQLEEGIEFISHNLQGPTGVIEAYLEKLIEKKG